MPMNYLKVELEELMKGDERVLSFVREASLDGIWYWDLEHPQNEWINEKLWNTLGYDPSDIAPPWATWRNFVHPQDIPLVEQLIANLDQGKEDHNSGVLRYQHFLGHTVWLRHHGLILRNGDDQPVRLLRTFIDITKEVVSNQMMRINHRLLESSFESFDNVLILSVDLNYNFLMFNKAFQKATFEVYGTMVEIGSSIFDCVTVAADRNKIKSYIDLAFQGEHPVSVEIYGELKHQYFETRYQRICDEQGEAIGVTVLSSNVTARVEAEKQLQDAFQELESFSYSLSHDLRAPLRSINGFAGVVGTDIGLDINEEARFMIHQIARSANQMSSLIDDVLRFAKAGNKELMRHPICMAAIVSDVIVELRDQCENYLFKVELEHLSPVFCDASMIRLVWVNLINNAIKYASKANRPTITIRATEEKERIVFKIIDNGIGFDMNHYHKLFAVFQRLHQGAEFAGNGVGLAVVQRIVNKHGGNVWATSSPLSQTCFYFSLPTYVD
jgi:signal transduction histidine kinase